jgi:uncharacterized protein (TIGR02996 family)
MSADQTMTAPRSVEIELLDAIAESPDDVQLRCVYADWLTQEGDELGEFILLDLAIPRLVDAERVLAVHRRAELFYRRDTFRSLHGPTIVKGLAERVSLTRRHDPSPITRPAREVLPRVVHVSGGDAAVLAELLSGPAARTIEEMHLQPSKPEAELVEVLVRLPKPPRLRRLWIHGDFISREDVASLEVDIVSQPPWLIGDRPDFTDETDAERVITRDEWFRTNYGTTDERPQPLR